MTRQYSDEEFNRDLKMVGGMFLRLAPVIILVVGVAVAKPLIAQMNATAGRLFAAVFIVVVTVYCSYFARYTERQMDEVERAGSRFASEAGQTIGVTVFVLLLILFPPFLPFMKGFVKWMAPQSPTEDDLIMGAMFVGVVGVGLMATAATIVVNAVWSWRIAKR